MFHITTTTIESPVSSLRLGSLHKTITLPKKICFAPQWQCQAGPLHLLERCREAPCLLMTTVSAIDNGTGSSVSQNQIKNQKTTQYGSTTGLVDCSRFLFCFVFLFVSRGAFSERIKSPARVLTSFMNSTWAWENFRN